MRKSLSILSAVAVVVAMIVVVTTRQRSVSDSDRLNGETTAASDSAKVPTRENSQDISEPSQEGLARSVGMRGELDAILEEPEYREWPSMLFDLMYDATLDEVAELLAISEDGSSYSLGFRDSMKAAAYERWYQLDPSTALSEMDASSLSESQKNSRMEVFLEDWASRSPDEVLAFLERRKLSGVTSDLTFGALVRGGASKGDLEVVDAALTRVEDPKSRYYALKSAARVLQRDHADQFDDWLGTLSAENQALAIAESAWIMAGENSDQALAGLKRLEEMEADNVSVTRARVLVKWAEKEPAKAAEWMVSQNVEGEEREMLFANLMSVWARKDRAAAVAWAEALIAEGKIDEAFMNRVAGRR